MNSINFREDTSLCSEYMHCLLHPTIKWFAYHLPSDPFVMVKVTQNKYSKQTNEVEFLIIAWLPFSGLVPASNMCCIHTSWKWFYIAIEHSRQYAAYAHLFSNLPSGAVDRAPPIAFSVHVNHKLCWSRANVIGCTLRKTNWSSVLPRTKI